MKYIFHDLKKNVFFWGGGVSIYVYFILNKYTVNSLKRYMISKNHKQNKPISMLESINRSKPTRRLMLKKTL